MDKLSTLLIARRFPLASDSPDLRSKKLGYGTFEGCKTIIRRSGESNLAVPVWVVSSISSTWLTTSSNSNIAITERLSCDLREWFIAFFNVQMVKLIRVDRAGEIFHSCMNVKRFTYLHRVINSWIFFPFTAVWLCRSCGKRRCLAQSNRWRHWQAVCLDLRPLAQ